MRAIFLASKWKHLAEKFILWLMLKIVKYIFCFERPGERGKPAADGVNYLFTVREAILENPAQSGAGQARAERGKLSYYCSKRNR